MLTVRGGVVPVAVLLHDFCCEVGEFVNTPNPDPCPVLILPTDVGGEVTQTELDEDRSLSLTLLFAVVETAASTKVFSSKLGRGSKRGGNVG